MYSVALERTEALFSLFAATALSSPSRSAPLGEALIPCLDAKRRQGTLSLNSAILSFRLARYRFSMTLWDLFLAGNVFDPGGETFADPIKTLSPDDDFLFLFMGSVDSGMDGRAGLL